MIHGKKGLDKKDKKRWHYDKILVHLNKFAPIMIMGSSIPKMKFEHLRKDFHVFTYSLCNQ